MMMVRFTRFALRNLSKVLAMFRTLLHLRPEARGASLVPALVEQTPLHLLDIARAGVPVILGDPVLGVVVIPVQGMGGELGHVVGGVGDAVVFAELRGLVLDVVADVGGTEVRLAKCVLKM